MPDGVGAVGPVVPDEGALVAERRLIRNVRRRLVLWSGLTTLVVLAILGVALYLSAARTLEASGIDQLTTRTNRIVDVIENPQQRPGGPEYGFIFGGNSSGTFAWAFDADGTPIVRGPGLPEGLPIRDS